MELGDFMHVTRLFQIWMDAKLIGAKAMQRSLHDEQYHPSLKTTPSIFFIRDWWIQTANFSPSSFFSSCSCQMIWRIFLAPNPKSSIAEPYRI